MLLWYSLSSISFLDKNDFEDVSKKRNLYFSTIMVVAILLYIIIDTFTDRYVGNIYKGLGIFVHAVNVFLLYKIYHYFNHNFAENTLGHAYLTLTSLVYGYHIFIIMYEHIKFLNK